MSLLRTSVTALFTSLATLFADTVSAENLHSKEQDLETCEAALAEKGVLKKGDEIAAAHLMAKDVLRIAIITADEQGDLPEDSKSSDLDSYLAFTKRSDVLFYHFPDEMQDIIRKSISRWHDGDVEFVAANDDPDIAIVSYAANFNYSNGIASFPENDILPTYGGRTAFAMVNVYKAEEPNNGYDVLFGKDSEIRSGFTNLTPNEIIKAILDHELGHVFGVLHTDEALDLLDPFTELCDEKVHQQNIMSPDYESNATKVTFGPYDDKAHKILQGPPSFH